jgi:hypothetical protein
MDKPIISDILPLVKEYRDKDGNGVGGNLHIVLDDGNINDSDIKFCLERAIETNDVDGIKLAEILLNMSKTQRSKISNLFYSL